MKTVLWAALRLNFLRITKAETVLLQEGSSGISTGSGNLNIFSSGTSIQNMDLWQYYLTLVECLRYPAVGCFGMGWLPLYVWKRLSWIWTGGQKYHIDGVCVQSSPDHEERVRGLITDTAALKGLWQARGRGGDAGDNQVAYIAVLG